MTNFRVQCAFYYDSGLPRDTIQINPCYNATDAQALVNQLKNNFMAHAQIGATQHFDIKAYSLDTPPPNYPVAEASNGTGSTTLTMPREVAICLSYYSGSNRPRSRGRLYLPAHWVAGGLALRPTQAQRDNAVGFASTLTNGLAANTWWVLYSRVTKTAHTVTNVWADDEWDTVRSRGLRSTTRTETSVP